MAIKRVCVCVIWPAESRTRHVNVHCKATASPIDTEKDKYLDTWCPIATAADRVATDHFQKWQSQDGRLPKLLLADSCLTNNSEAASLWLVMPKQVVGDHQCCNEEYLNFGMQNLRPSNVKVIS